MPEYLAPAASSAATCAALAAAALAGESPLIAIDLAGREPAAALLAVVIARAPHRATLVLASDAPSPVTDRTIVTVAASAAEVPA